MKSCFYYIVPFVKDRFKETPVKNKTFTIPVEILSTEISMSVDRLYNFLMKV